MTAEQEQVEALARRCDQIERTAHHVRPADVGKWASAQGLARGPADSALIAPADLRWLIQSVRDIQQARAEATAAVAAQVEETLERLQLDQSRYATIRGIAADLRAALTPDAGVALRAREAKALRDAADAWRGGPTGAAPIPAWWLRDRAAALEAGEG